MDTVWFFLQQGVTLVAAQNASIDCNGKSFYCTSATEFVHCIESEPGVFSAEKATTACPANTICDNSVAFECSGGLAQPKPQVMPGRDLTFLLWIWIAVNR